MKKREDQWQPGDLVQVSYYERRGWGDESLKCVFMVLRRAVPKRPRQIYPLTAELDAYNASKKEYVIMTPHGKIHKINLDSWREANSSCTTSLLQRICDGDA